MVITPMSIEALSQPDSAKPLRLWPGIAAAALLLLVKFAVPIALPGEAIIGMLGAVACGAAIATWWLFFSRAPGVERTGTSALMAAGDTVRVDPAAVKDGDRCRGRGNAGDSGPHTERSGVARLSRAESGRHRSRRTHQHGLVGLASGRNVAAAGRTRLVVLCGPRRH